MFVTDVDRLGKIGYAHPLNARTPTVREDAILRARAEIADGGRLLPLPATVPAVVRRDVTRTRLILLSAHGARTAHIAQDLGFTEPTVRRWIRAFNAQGIEGLDNPTRLRRQGLYTAADRDRIVAVAQTSPRALGLSHNDWTLDLLTAYVHTVLGIPMGRTRIYGLSARFLRHRRGPRPMRTPPPPEPRPDPADRPLGEGGRAPAG